MERPCDAVMQHQRANSLGAMWSRVAARRAPAKTPVECGDGPQSHITRWYITDEVSLLTLVPPIALLMLSNRMPRK